MNECTALNFTPITPISVASVIDAKSQRKTYTYDSYGRVTIVKRGTVVGGTFTEDISQRDFFPIRHAGFG